MTPVGTEAPSPGGWLSGGLDRSTLVAAGVATLGLIMAVLDTTIVNVALDTLSRELHAPKRSTNRRDWGGRGGGERCLGRRRNQIQRTSDHARAVHGSGGLTPPYFFRPRCQVAWCGACSIDSIAAPSRALPSCSNHARHSPRRKTSQSRGRNGSSARSAGRETQAVPMFDGQFPLESFHAFFEEVRGST